MNNDEKYIDSEQLFDNDRDTRGYYEWNREDPSALHLDGNENAIDSLETIIQFLDRDDNLKWKWIVFAFHHSLYSFCVSALEKGNYANVLMKGKEDDICVQFDKEKPIKSEIQRFSIKGYKTPAFRIIWNEIEEFPQLELKKNNKIKKEILIGFWSDLARVQDQKFWMGRLFGQKAVPVNDEELEQIVWLIEKVRNDLAHFIPKGYSIDIYSIIKAIQVILDKIDFLVFQSFSILFIDSNKSQKRIKNTLEKINGKLIIELEKVEMKKGMNSANC